jgi:quercetin dioxygenase-like cupin family protein
VGEVYPVAGRRNVAPIAVDRLGVVDAVDLRELVAFDDAGPTRSDVVESERLWSELLCLERNQRYGPVRDHESDALFLVVAGEVVVQTNRARKRMKQWSVVLVPAETEVLVTNASADPAVLLVITAPPPTPRAVSG